MGRRMKRHWLWAVTAACALLLSGCGGESSEADGRTELVVYTAIEAEHLQAYAAAFEADNPDLKIRWMRESTGIVTAKLLAEGAGTSADAVWGLAATSMTELDRRGLLAPYAPVGADRLNRKFLDRRDPPHWIGTNAWVAVICVNTVEAEKLGLPMPTSWRDLAKPVYRGHVAMPDPASSGTGFLCVSSWIQLFGEAEAWAYMDALHENMAWYTHSGSKPGKQAAAGEIPIGISFAFRAAKSKSQGAPLAIVVPDEGVGWDMETVAIVKTGTRQEAARRLVDWAISRRAMDLYVKHYAVVAMPDVAAKIEHYPDLVEGAMIDNDFTGIAARRDEILRTWQARYGTRAVPGD